MYIYIYIYIYTYIYIYLLNVTNYGSDSYVFNGEDKITKTINKAKKQFYPKDKIFLVFYQELENENELCFDEKKQEATSTTYMLFAEQGKDIVRLLTLCSFKTPFELLLADIADVRFLAKAAVNSKYCLLFCLFVHIENLHLAHEN